MFIIKLGEQYLSGTCDDLGRHVLVESVGQAHRYTKAQAETVKAGDARLKEAQLIQVVKK